jgi:lysophospholipase L1-like esterase
MKGMEGIKEVGTTCGSRWLKIKKEIDWDKRDEKDRNLFSIPCISSTPVRSFLILRAEKIMLNHPLPQVVLTILFILTLSPLTISAKDPITVYLAGDSTCANKTADKRPETGWGEMLGAHFKDGKVKIDNRALNGRSTRSFIAEGHWKEIIDVLKKGDYVFIEFGHNDQKEGTDRYASGRKRRYPFCSRRLCGGALTRRVNFTTLTASTRMLSGRSPGNIRLR